MCSDGQDGLNVCDGCDDEGVDMQGIVKDFGRVEVGWVGEDNGGVGSVRGFVRIFRKFFLKPPPVKCIK